jgi:hypothetical protein
VPSHCHKIRLERDSVVLSGFDGIFTLITHFLIIMFQPNLSKDCLMTTDIQFSGFKSQGAVYAIWHMLL